MYQENHTFHTPERSKTVWRYIDFTKFVDLLLNRELFFTRSDKFKDPYEGRFKLKDHAFTKDFFGDQALTKKFYFLNCWHINEVQSDAMWKIFLNTHNGIAIKSSVNNIIESLSTCDDDVYISQIYYRNYDQVTFEDLRKEPQNQTFIGRGTAVSQFNYKRSSFEHEREMRLFFVDRPIPHITRGEKAREPLNHKRIKVDLETLVNEVVVAPFADNWFKDLVETLVNQLKVNLTISKSNLYDYEE